VTTTLKAPVSRDGAHNTKKPSPVDHLTAADIAQLGAELDAIRESVISSRGERDSSYIRKVIANQRRLELGSRALLLFSLFPPAWVAGTVGLSVAKIVDNMEIGHNVMHGQWDWMRDPQIHSTTWEWDNASPAKAWKHSHNEIHHTWTNVLGKDLDIGYGVLRMDEEQRWSKVYLGQPLYNVILALGFEYFIAAQDLEIGRYLKGKKDKAQFKAERSLVLTKIRKQMQKDYLLHPLLSGPSFVPTLLANATANLVRNIWTHSVIFCGHFPAEVQVFEKTTIDDETRGDWYIRQMMGSCNISGGPVLHLMSGNLSFQIEHHLFPDLPSNRYHEIAPQVQALCERYAIPYVTGPLPKQVGSAWAKVIRLAAPNDFWRNAGSALGLSRSRRPAKATITRLVRRQAGSRAA
jgi:fatty acid desaturase